MPAHPDITEIEDTWQEFHRVVNMTSQELSDWLRTGAAGEEAEQLPDAAGRRARSNRVRRHQVAASSRPCVAAS
jgi:hypothetical protein